MQKEKKARLWKWTWFKIALLVLLISYVLLFGTCSAVIAAIEKQETTFRTRQTVTVCTDLGDTLVLKRIQQRTLMDPAYSLGLEWNGQTLSCWSEDHEPVDLATDDWYLPREQTQLAEGHRIYDFTWGTVTVLDGKVSWELHTQRGAQR